MRSPPCPLAGSYSGSMPGTILRSCQDADRQRSAFPRTDSTVTVTKTAATASTRVFSSVDTRQAMSSSGAGGESAHAISGTLHDVAETARSHVAEAAGAQLRSPAPCDRSSGYHSTGSGHAKARRRAIRRIADCKDRRCDPRRCSTTDAGAPRTLAHRGAARSARASAGGTRPSPLAAKSLRQTIL